MRIAVVVCRPLKGQIPTVVLKTQTGDVHRLRFTTVADGVEDSVGFGWV